MKDKPVKCVEEYFCSDNKWFKVIKIEDGGIVDVIGPLSKKHVEKLKRKQMKEKND